VYEPEGLARGVFEDGTSTALRSRDAGEGPICMDSPISDNHTEVIWSNEAVSRFSVGQYVHTRTSMSTSWWRPTLEAAGGHTAMTVLSREAENTCASSFRFAHGEGFMCKREDHGICAGLRLHDRYRLHGRFRSTEVMASTSRFLLSVFLRDPMSLTLIVFWGEVGSDGAAMGVCTTRGAPAMVTSGTTESEVNMN
jgi:hypothetical protein